jgi:pimeloyl-ACP methyl ester carboxylesterase
MPPADSFEYSIAALASLTIAFTEKLGLTSYAIFVQDYGAPIGWRMALEHPERITAIIIQNGNAYEDGIVEEVWAEVVAYGHFALERHAAEIAVLVDDFLDRALAR